MPAQYHISGTTANAIAESIERGIDGGRFRSDEALPTIRALAGTLGVSPTTVSAAFALLRRRGRIVGRRRGGSIVVAKSALQSGAEHVVARGTRNLAVANPDPSFLPPMLAALTAELVERRLYTDIRDSAALATVARRAFAADGIAADHVGIASGAMDAIERALVATLSCGDVVALEDPTFPPYVELARALDLRIVRVAVDERGVVPTSLREAIRAGAKALVEVPRAQNPTGASFDEARVRELERALATVPEFVVIEDDFLANLCGVPLVSLVRKRKRWLHVRSLGKTLGPDLRVAPFAGDALTVARIAARQRLGCGWVSIVLQDAAAWLLRDATTKKRLRDATRAYAQRRAGFLEALADVGLAGTPGAGFMVWIPVRDEAAAVGAARAAGFTIDGGARYREHAPPGVRIVTTTLGPQEARALATALASAGRSAAIIRP